MTDTDMTLPNPFLVTEADRLLAALEQRLVYETVNDRPPLFLDPAFMVRLEAAVIAAGDTPARESVSRRLVARLRELR